MKHLVHVTADDISKGCKMDVENCPVARAMVRDVPGALIAMVTGRYAYTYDKIEIVEDDGVTVVRAADDAKSTYYNMPRSVKRFVRNFDKGSDVKPFNFYAVPAYVPDFLSDSELSF